MLYVHIKKVISIKYAHFAHTTRKDRNAPFTLTRTRRVNRFCILFAICAKKKRKEIQKLLMFVQRFEHQKLARRFFLYAHKIYTIIEMLRAILLHIQIQK